MATEALPQRPEAWLRRHRTKVAGAVAALLVYTLAGVFLVPRIIRSQIEGRARDALHREARVDDVRFNPFTLVATLTGLHLLDRDRVELLAIDRVLVNLEVSGLFRRAFRFKEIRIDRPALSARIMRDGAPSVADLLQSPSSSPAGPWQPPRLIVDRLLMTGGLVRFSDESRQPRYESRFQPLDLDIKDLITLPREGGEHVLTVGVGNGARLHWSGRQTVEPLEFAGRLDITGLELAPLWDYFAAGQPLGVRDGRLDLALPYRIRRGASAPFDLQLTDASAQVTGLAVRPRSGGTDWLTLPDSRIGGVSVQWPASRIEVARVAVARPSVLARLDAGGRWNWQDAVQPGSQGGGGGSWTYRIGTIDVEGGQVNVEGALSQQPTPLTVSDLRLHAAGITSQQAQPISFDSSARVLDRGSVTLGGTVAPSLLGFDVSFDVAAIELTALQPFMTVPDGVRLVSGAATLKGTATQTAGATPALKVAAAGSLTGLELQDSAGQRLASWRAMTIDGFTLDDPPNRARVRRITIDRPFAKLLIDQQGNLNLTRLADTRRTTPVPARPVTAAQGTASLTATSPAARTMPTVEVGTIAIRDGSAEFADQSLPLPFSAQIHSANGTIRDLSSFASAPATIDVEGRVDKTGFVKVGGTLRTSDPLASSEITMAFRSIDMLGLTPYFAEFAGYEVRSGTLDLDVRYQVQSRRLVGNHSVIARNLVLGDRVRDSRAPNFAVRLAVALLKDREGRININVPIEGTVDSPEFNYRQVFWAAMRTILGNAAKAPFRALGRLFGRDEDDLELVEFDPGRSDLLPAERDTLTRLAEQLAQRGELTMAVEGRFDPKADPPPMKRAKLEALIESRRAAATAAAAPGSSALETILESLFVEQFSAEALQAERQRFTAAPADVATPAPAVAPPPAQPVAATGALDATAFYESLRQKLLDAQVVTEADLRALASARAATIVGILTNGGTLTSARISTSAPAPVKRSKTGSSRIASEMTMSASDS